MTIGERLLNLTIEYKDAVAAEKQLAQYGGVTSRRAPVVIAADYEAAIRELLA